jgi:hypothetical protein
MRILEPRALKNIAISALLTAACTPAWAQADDSCSNIVAATVAELRAGAAGWDEAIEALVRSAAGSACVKAQSGAYVSAPASPAPGAAEDASAEVSGNEPAAEPEALAAADTTETSDAAEDDGKAGWKFLGFEVNSVTGSPGQKPYERKR